MAPIKDKDIIYKKILYMRKEHPRPQFYRKNWINLNGKWTCEFSKNIKGFSNTKINKNKFSSNINVPFCPESK